MDYYIGKLIQQFKEADGTMKSDITSDELADFIIDRGKIGTGYKELLDSIGLGYYRFESTCEVGKGNYDTIVKPHDTTIVSPFAFSIEGVDDSRIIVANLVVQKNNPYLVSPNQEMHLLKHGKPFRAFIMHNPYSERYYKDWEQLHNMRDFNIIVGVYGRLSDKDMDSKIDQVKRLAVKLDNFAEFEYETSRGAYFALVGSRFPVKEKIKLLTRSK